MRLRADSGTAFRPRRLMVLGLLLLSVVCLAIDQPQEAVATSRGSEPSVDETTLTQVEQYLETQRSALGLPGLAAGIVVGDEVFFLKGFGETRADGAPVEPDTPFMLASTAKSLTALALMQLVEQRLVDLDLPVSTYLPELVPGGDLVTVRDVMHHRSGLSKYVGNEPLVGEMGSSLKASVERLGPMLKAHAEYAYSNANYDTLALIIERASGVPFADYMAANVFGPLQMDRSFHDREQAKAAGLAQGHYRWLFLGYREHDALLPPGLAGSATMFSSAEDLTHVLITHLNDGLYEGTRIVSEESIRVLHETMAIGSDAIGGYAGGWWVNPAFPADLSNGPSELTLVWHDGVAPAHRSVLWMVPEVDLGFVLLANGRDLSDDSLFVEVSRGVRFLLFDLEPPDLTSRSPVLRRWGKQLLLAVLVGQILLAIAVVPTLNRVRRGVRPERRDWVSLAVATALDVAAIASILWIIPAAGESPLRATLTYPDYRIIIVGMSTGVAWGVMRTGLVGIGLLRQRRGPVPAATQIGTSTSQS